MADNKSHPARNADKPASVPSGGVVGQMPPAPVGPPGDSNDEPEAKQAAREAAKRAAKRTS